MKIYCLKPDYHDYIQIATKNPDEQEALFKILDGYSSRNLSLRDRWLPFEVEGENREKDHDDRPLGDYRSLLLLTVLSERAVKELWNLIEGKGELLPLRCDEGDYFVFNVTFVLDVLDQERSDLVRVGDKIILINKHVFRPDDRLEHEAIFKTPENANAVYVTQSFKERVEESGLTGFRFQETGDAEVRVPREPTEEELRERRENEEYGRVHPPEEGWVEYLIELLREFEKLPEDWAGEIPTDATDLEPDCVPGCAPNEIAVNGMKSVILAMGRHDLKPHFFAPLFQGGLEIDIHAGMKGCNIISENGGVLYAGVADQRDGSHEFWAIQGGDRTEILTPVDEVIAKIKEFFQE